MTTVIRSGATLIATFALAGCMAQDGVNATPPTTPPPAPTTVPPVDVSVDPGTEVSLNPEEVPPEAPFRQRRRMDLDQLDATIRTVTGGIGWTETRSGREVNLFQDLAQTLGKPDYLQITDEDLEPSAMFQKFLDDAARSVCMRLMDAEATRARADRVFFVHAEATDTLGAQREATLANLQYLLLRFHGRKVAVDAPELEPWRWLMESAEHVTPDQPEVWRTVCVGLMTHPDFYTY